MKLFNKLIPLVKPQLFICMVLSMNFGLANTSSKTTTNHKPSASDIDGFNEKVKLDKQEGSKKSTSNSNFHAIMSTKGDCSASCCTSNNSTQKADKSKSKKGKKIFGWFSRSK
tara:strand:+ start:233 stop:571 length:339 start_codon:yes stop_codon:yes gene_type:complete